MSQLGSLRERIPTGESLYTILAMVFIIVIALGLALFFSSSILPQLEIREGLASQLTSAEVALMEAEASRDHSTDDLVQQVATAQARLDAAANYFLDEAQAAQVLGSLYEYATKSGVEITDLQAQPLPEEKEKTIYDARTFQLQAEGDVLKLVDFVSRLRGELVKNLTITNVSITGDEGINTLMMNVTLYTSPYAAGSATPSATPAATPENLAQLEEALAIAWAAEDWQQAIGLINQIRTADPDYAGMSEKLYAARVNYGYRLLDEEDIQGATRQFNLTLEIKPDGEEALAGLERAAATPPPTLTVVQELEQRLHQPWATEDWKEVINLLEQILDIDPEYDDMMEKLYAAHVNYGYKLVAEGRLEEAKDKFIIALAINPDGVQAMEGLRQLAGDTPFPTPPPPETPTPPSEQIVHVVQPGDTLYSLARRYGTTVEAIRAANGLTGDAISVGQRLIIPGGSSPTPEGDQYTIYVVRAGDTLYSISRRYDVTVQAIMAANGLTSTHIRVGQQLRIPT